MLEVFTTASRGKSMVCILEMPERDIDNDTLVVFCHGFAGHKITPHRMAPNLSRTLAQKGYSMLRADCIGSGDSEGGPEFMTILGEVEDQEAAYKRALQFRSWDRVIILGYSLGGTIAALLTERIESCGLILWAPVSDPYWNIHHILGEELFLQGVNGEDISFQGDYISHTFFENLDKIDPIKVIKEYEHPVKVIHGTSDMDVLPVNGLNYFNNAKNGNIHLIQDADHAFSDARFQEELMATTISYIEDIT